MGPRTVEITRVSELLSTHSQSQLLPLKLFIFAAFLSSQAA